MAFHLYLSHFIINCARHECIIALVAILVYRPWPRTDLACQYGT